MAKFCPKCGLPLKEDTTLMGSNNGSYVVDDSGPSPWVLAGGALGIVIVALSIGWITGQGQHKTDTVVRQPITPPSMPNTGLLNAAPSFNWGSSAPVQASANYNPNVRWVYVPPSRPAQPVLPQVAPNPGPRPEDMPPPNMGVMLAISQPPRQAPVVTAVLPVEPVAPPVAVMAAVPGFGYSGSGMPVVDTSPSLLTAVQAPEPDAIPAAAGREDPRSDWVYDPVQERWAIRTENAQARMSPHVLVRPRASVRR
jgi:hypothetical protein